MINNELKHLSVNNFKLTIHIHVKYLGIFIDKFLSCKKRLSPSLKTCFSAHHFSFNRYFLDSCVAWSYPKEISIDRVNKQNKQCFLILNFSDFKSHTNDLPAKLKLLKVKDVFMLNKFVLICLIILYLIMFDYIMFDYVWLKVAFLIKLRSFLLSFTI